jgi:hypothetical protein
MADVKRGPQVGMGNFGTDLELKKAQTEQAKARGYLVEDGPPGFVFFFSNMEDKKK